MPMPSVRWVASFLLLLGIVLVALNYYPSEWAYYQNVQTFHELYANVGTELVGIAITVLFIDALNERRQEAQLKAQLIREMGSTDNGIALQAVREIEARGELTDGTLIGKKFKKADLDGAELQGADLRSTGFQGANLNGADLRGADLRGADL